MAGNEFHWRVLRKGTLRFEIAKKTKQKRFLGEKKKKKKFGHCERPADVIFDDVVEQLTARPDFSPSLLAAMADQLLQHLSPTSFLFFSVCFFVVVVVAFSFVPIGRRDWSLALDFLLSCLGWASPDVPPRHWLIGGDLPAQPMNDSVVRQPLG